MTPYKIKGYYLIILIIFTLTSIVKSETCVFEGENGNCSQSDTCMGNFYSDSTESCKQDGKVSTICCVPITPDVIVGGEPAKFPHMALLGFPINGSTNISWECGGSLISSQWVLTAAHCLWSKNTQTSVKYVRLGSENLDSALNPPMTKTIVKIISHPKYRPGRVYNDIALLKMKRWVRLSLYVTPACIHDTEDEEFDFDDTYATAIGYGDTTYRGSSSKTLLKVTLEKFNFKECKVTYPKSRKQPQGLLNAIQMCYGSKTEQKDTCQGDSGGPLFISEIMGACGYTVIGVTSVGKSCGTIGVPGIYTRVSAYANWIKEKISTE